MIGKCGRLLGEALQCEFVWGFFLVFFNKFQILHEILNLAAVKLQTLTM